MKTRRKGLSGFLSSVDLFEDPIHLNLKGETALTSSLGGLLSIAILTFLAYQAVVQSVDMFNRADPKIIQMNEYQNVPSEIRLDKANDFVIAVTVTKNDTVVNMTSSSIISFTSTFNRYYRSPSGDQTRSKADIYWMPCTRDNFTLLPDNTFDLYSLAYAYCPSQINYTDSSTGKCPADIAKDYPDCVTPPNLFVKGTFLSQGFEFVQLKVMACNPSHKLYMKGLKCTTEDVSTVFQSSEITLNLYYSNSLMDLMNYGTPKRNYLDSLYWNLNPVKTIAADIFVDLETVQDYNDYFSTDAHNNRAYYTVQTQSVRELRKFQSASLLECNMRRGNINRITMRKYTQVLDVVSNIGGLSELFMLLGFYASIGYLRFKYQMILSNEWYDFEPEDDKKKRDKEKMNETVSTILALTARPLAEGSDSSRANRLRSFFGIKGKKSQVQNKTVKDYFELQKKRKRTLKYDEFSYLKMILKLIFCIKESPDEKMAKKGRREVAWDSDIIKIMEKLKEVDRLKILLLNPDQRKAFDFIEKPMIAITQNKPIHAEKSQLITNAPEYDSLSDYAKVYMAYRALLGDSEPENAKYNEKLLEMIGEELRTVFRRVDQIMGSEPDPKRFEEIVSRIMSKPSGLARSDTNHTTSHLEN